MNNTFSENIPAMLFDLDGVLVDSEGEYSVFWQGVGDSYGLGPSFSADIKGTTIGEILLNFPEADRAGILARLHAFEDNMSYPVFYGVIPFLKALRSAGIPSAVVTSSDDVKMSYLRKRQPELLSLIDTVVTGSMVTRSKPDPEGYLLAARRLGVPIERCFVFEDSIQGLQAGKSSGAKVVGIATTNPRSRVAPLADITVDRFSEITLPSLL